MKSLYLPAREESWREIVTCGHKPWFLSFQFTSNRTVRFLTALTNLFKYNFWISVSFFLYKFHCFFFLLFLITIYLYLVLKTRQNPFLLPAGEGIYIRFYFPTMPLNLSIKKKTLFIHSVSLQALSKTSSLAHSFKPQFLKYLICFVFF